ncbi:DUF6221 family protein [Nocardia sp. NPDC059091]|uniref:DUF6221 family protein n=1 Tax=unclassified Nocardia TaxID=2637762 RepID=UPI0036BCFDC1
MDISAFIAGRLDKQQEAAEFALTLERDFRDTGRVIKYEWVRHVRRRGSRTAPSSVFLPGAPTPKELLRHQAALRLILGQHTPDAGGHCSVCRQPDSRGGHEPAAWPCPTVRAVAGIWSDHRDYPLPRD